MSSSLCPASVWLSLYCTNFVSAFFEVNSVACRKRSPLLINLPLMTKMAPNQQVNAGSEICLVFPVSMADEGERPGAEPREGRCCRDSIDSIYPSKV